MTDNKINKDIKSDVAKREEDTLRYWQEKGIFEASLKNRAGKPEFVFYDGPPFATGLPHTGSLLSSVIKDVIPRYKTMRGFYVRRRWGWDTHGLPIENMVEKDLGLKSKKDIEAMGIEKFNEACRAKVLMYVRDWKLYVDRVGRWVDFDNSYKTMDATYTESIWWALKELHKKGLLYEGRKVLMYCPHCETPLAKAEIAQDNSYKDIIEEAVTVKFKIKNIAGLPLTVKAGSNVYLLAWTTTPWTLPANVALAVGGEIDYVAVLDGQDVCIISSATYTKNDKFSGKYIQTFQNKPTMKGKELEGLEYESIYEIDAVKKTGKRSHYVALADFVNTEDGRGIVHTAVIYGEDDYQLGLKNDLPMVPLLNPNGTYNDDAPEFLRGQYIKKADKMVIEDLEKRGLLFAKAPNTHSYPHCHRCNTPLIYNALSSWFIDVQKNKKEIIKQNENINWVPEHLKHGRFGNILEGAPDWTISRNRYWASPLPIWKCGECKKVEVVGSLDDLEKLRYRKANTYYLVRHAHSQKNDNGEGGFIATVLANDKYHLTDKGREEANDTAAILAKGKIDLVVTSPFLRTRETADIITKATGAAQEVDERLREISLGQEMEGNDWTAWRVFEAKRNFDDKINPESESCRDMLLRMKTVVSDLDKKYEGKRIVLVGHGDPMWMLKASLMGLSPEETLKQKDAIYPKRGEVKAFESKNYPYNSRGELDFHRPYIDEIKLKCSCGGQMSRIPEVVDCWVESGSMPFAEYHYPLENKSDFEKRSPGDFIAEYVGQTRTWFYYLHTLSTLLFGHEAFKNVVVTGNILAADGSKMSKSKGNYTDPLELIARYGADAYRYHLMTSVVMAAEDFNFTDDGVKEVQQRLVNILWNTVLFYQMYAGETPNSKGKSQNYNSKSENVLDKWILARLAELHKEVTENLDKYDTIKAGRPIKDFVTDFSTWYIRRSRDRFKSDDVADREAAISTTRFVLLELAKIIAPFMPFLAEQVYKAVGGPLASVHLEDWTKSLSEYEHSDILRNMRMTRDIVTLALEARSVANVKVRQPLQYLRYQADKLGTEYEKLIAEEINVKEVKYTEEIREQGGRVAKESNGIRIALNIEITPELKLEGDMRDLVRQIQEKRKDLGLAPSDKIVVTLPASLGDLVTRFSEEIKKSVNATTLTVGNELQIEKYGI